MDKIFDAIMALYKEAHEDPPRTDDEVIYWATQNGLITVDEFGAFCLLGMSQGIPVYES